MSPLAYDCWIALNILFSAGLYLFDFITNVLTAIKFYGFQSLDKELAKYGAPEKLRFTAFFPAILSLMVAGHVLNAIVLWHTLPPDERPIFLAFFFPLVQLWRLAKLLWVSCTCRGIRSLESDLKPIYNILAAALETGPQVMLQTYAIVKWNWAFFTTQTDLSSKEAYQSLVKFEYLSHIVPLSIFASTASLAFNGAIALIYANKKASFAGKLGVAVAGGMHTFGSLALRATSLAALTRFPYPRYRFFVPFILIGVAATFAHIYFLTRKATQIYWLRLLECLGFSCMSFTVGPLYAMLKVDSKFKDHDREMNGKRGMLYPCLSSACSIHVLLDVIICAYRVLGVNSQNPFCDYNGVNFSQVLQPLFFQRYNRRVCYSAYLPIFIIFIIVYIISFVMFIMVDFYARDGESISQRLVPYSDSPYQNKDPIALDSNQDREISLQRRPFQRSFSF